MSALTLYLIGSLVFAGSLGLVWKANATRWNRLARAYAADEPADHGPVRRMQTVVLTGGGVAFNSYRGVVTVGSSGAGITLCLLPPWSVFHPPIWIPHADLTVRPTSWYVNSNSYKYSLAGAHDVEIVVDEELMEWIEAQAAGVRSDAGASVG